MFVASEASLNEQRWTDYTLIMPCVSVGNVGQLTTDLIVSTLWMYKVGSFDTDAVVPVVGNNPFASAASGSEACDLSTTLEVYESQEKQLVAIQQRSPCVPGRGLSLVRLLEDFIRRFSFQRVVVLTSAGLMDRRDDAIMGPQQRYLPSDLVTELDRKRLAGVGFTMMTGLPEAGCGSGLARAIMNACSRQSVPAIMLLAYVAEGDNTQDAVQLAKFANQFLDLVDLSSTDAAGRQMDWRIPTSWRLMFGTRVDQVLFQ